MSRYRLYPTPAQAAGISNHCGHARYVWNLALEQWSMWTRGKGSTPEFVEQARQLTEARAGFGWVRFRVTRALPAAKSYRVKRDNLGRWHIAFAIVPDPIPAPRTGAVVGIDRGVTVSAALSTGDLLTRPGLADSAKRRLAHLQQRLARAVCGSNRRKRVKEAIAKLHAQAADRKDWVERINPAYTRQTCSRCGHCAPGNRENQAFLCQSCGHRDHADLNAAMNIAAGRAVSARRDRPVRMSVKREPQLTTSA